MAIPGVVNGASMIDQLREAVKRRAAIIRTVGASLDTPLMLGKFAIVLAVADLSYIAAMSGWTSVVRHGKDAGR